MEAKVHSNRSLRQFPSMWRRVFSGSLVWATHTQPANHVPTRRLRRYPLPALAFASGLACFFLGCKSTPEALALIHYAQLGACTRAQTGQGAINVPPSHAVVIFRVASVDNSKVPINWSFDSTALVVNPPSQNQQNLGGTGAVAIGANKTVPLSTLVGIVVETNNADGTDASATNYFLIYPRVSPAPGALAVKDNPTQLSYPFTADCNAIAGR